MQFPESPRIFLKPFASDGAKNDIPDVKTTTGDGYASMTDGFPSETQLPIASGGIPPRRADMNGILNAISQLNRYLSFGPVYMPFSSVIAANGGYPLSAMIRPDLNTDGRILMSGSDYLTSNPNTDPTVIGTEWYRANGVPDYCPGVNHYSGELVIWPDNLMCYRCKRMNGPNYGGVKLPSDPEYWISLPDWIAESLNLNLGDYYANPNTLALRDKYGKTQVSDPVHELDAVNLRTLRNHMSGSGGVELGKPIITAPPRGTVIGSLTFNVTVTPLELLSGGIPEPSRTQVRVLSEDLSIIHGTTVQPYSLTPAVYLPDDFPAGAPFHVIVRHENAHSAWSPWSDPSDAGGMYTLDPISLTRIRIIQPPSGADSVPPSGFMIALAAGSWTDGSEFIGSLTRCAIHSESDDSIVWETGTADNPWVEYTTTITVLKGALAPGTNYWIEAQHKAASAPASNPTGVLTSPAYTKDFSGASRIRTMAASAPDVQHLQHDILGSVLSGSFTPIHIWGATSTDGGNVSYRITGITGGLAISKTSGILDNEEIMMVAPTIAKPSQSATLQIVAVSEYGAESAPVPVPISIIGQTEWIFDTPGVYEFTVPITALYRIVVGGGGGAGSGVANGPGSIPVGCTFELLGSAGGGGGVAVRVMTLVAGTKYTVVVGDSGKGRWERFMLLDPEEDGGTSSFGSLLSATGGKGGTPSDSYINQYGKATTVYEATGGEGGIGIGGDQNFHGGKGGNAKRNTSAYGRGASGGGGAGDGGDGGDGEDAIFNNLKEPGMTAPGLAGSSRRIIATAGESVGLEDVAVYSDPYSPTYFKRGPGGEAAIGGGGGGSGAANGPNSYSAGPQKWEPGTKGYDGGPGGVYIEIV